MLALLGPSGCGKTTLLRIIAGLETPDAGDGAGRRPGAHRRRGRGASGTTTHRHGLPGLGAVPSSRRGCQRGLRPAACRPPGAGPSGGRGARDGGAQRTRASDAPGTLSGGQQQRVALARAIAPQPEVLLLDEPFSNLDTALRVQVRTEVHQLLVELGITTVFVTHDQEEAFVLGDEVAVMHDGEVVQQASPAALYRTPADRFVAAFVGDANLLPGSADGAMAHTSIGTLPLATSAEGLVDVLVRPEECKLRPGTEGQIELIEFYGHDTVYVVRVGGDRRRAGCGRVAGARRAGARVPAGRPGRHRLRRRAHFGLSGRAHLLTDHPCRDWPQSYHRVEFLYDNAQLPTSTTATPPKPSGGRRRSVWTGPSSCGRLCVVISIGWRRRATMAGGTPSRSITESRRSPISPTGDPQRTGPIGLSMQRGEIWFAATPGGDRPVLVLTRDPVADRIGAVVVAARLERAAVCVRSSSSQQQMECRRQRRQLRQHQHDPSWVVRRKVTSLSPARMADACRKLQAATGC